MNFLKSMYPQGYIKHGFDCSAQRDITVVSLCSYLVQVSD